MTPSAGLTVLNLLFLFATEGRLIQTKPCLSQFIWHPIDFTANGTNLSVLMHSRDILVKFVNRVLSKKGCCCHSSVLSPSQHWFEPPRQNNFLSVFFFGKHIHMSYFGATGTPVLDFWCHLLWSGFCLICIAEVIPEIPLWCYRLPTSCWSALWSGNLRWWPNVSTYRRTPQALAWS